MYENGLPKNLILSAIKRKYALDISVNTLNALISKEKWKRLKEYNHNETVNSLPLQLSNEIQKILENDDIEDGDVIQKISELFNKSYSVIYDRLENTPDTLNIEDLIRILSVSSKALVELRKQNKYKGNVILQFNVDINYDNKIEIGKEVDKIIETKIEEVGDTFDDIAKISYQSAMRVNANNEDINY